MKYTVTDLCGLRFEHLHTVTEKKSTEINLGVANPLLMSPTPKENNQTLQIGQEEIMISAIKLHSANADDIKFDHLVQWLFNC